MQRVFKGFTGYSAERDDKPATHVILTIDKYNELLHNIKKAESDTRSVKSIADSEVKKIKSDSEIIRLKEQKVCSERLEALQSDFNSSKVGIPRLNDLNVNLLRICKERANSKRDIKPKKHIMDIRS